MNTRELFWYFIGERHRIYLAKEGGANPPWTADPILQNYKFTNVYRELDRTSKWIADNWREPHKSDKDVWFSIAVSVLSNKIETMEALGYPVPWKKQRYINVLTEHGFGSAYMLTTHRKQIPRPVYYAEILDILWRYRDILGPHNFDTLEAWHSRLSRLDGLASFTTGQIIAGSKYILDKKAYSDWWTFAPQGPGSTRGLSRYNGLPLKTKWESDAWKHAIQYLRKELYEQLGHKFHGQDVQNCLCEFDKYCRLRFNEGQVKHLYRGGK